METASIPTETDLMVQEETEELQQSHDRWEQRDAPRNTAETIQSTATRHKETE